MYQLIRDVYNLLLDSVLPIRCAACKRESKEAVCADCLRAFPLAVTQRCIVCEQDSPFGLTHAKCKTKTSPDRFISALRYKDSLLAESIIVGKYKFVSEVFSVLGKRMAEILSEDLALLNVERTICAPLPLHQRRLRWRGFNQSDLLALSISERLDIPHADILTRIRYTKTQKDLANQTARTTNVAKCFSLARNADVRGKTVLVIDDVTTTGATLREAAKVLKLNGAGAVWCLALAQD